MSPFSSLLARFRDERRVSGKVATGLLGEGSPTQCSDYSRNVLRLSENAVILHVRAVKALFLCLLSPSAKPRCWLILLEPCRSGRVSPVLSACVSVQRRGSLASIQFLHS